jgi:hypothetical protein
VVETWQTTFPNQAVALQHVRIHLVANKDVLISSSAFRIAVTVDGRTETAYGYAGIAPAYQRANWLNGNGPPTTTLSTVDAADDLGRASVPMRRGDEITKVVTFVVRAGAQFNKAEPAALTWVIGR